MFNRLPRSLESFVGIWNLWKLWPSISESLGPVPARLSLSSRNRVFIPPTRFFAGLSDISLTSKCLSVSCSSIWYAVGGRFSFPDANLDLLVGRSSSPWVKLAALLTSDRFLRPISHLAGENARVVRIRSLISPCYSSGQQFFNNSLNFLFLVDIIVQLHVIILSGQYVAARLWIKRVNVKLLNSLCEINAKFPFVDMSHSSCDVGGSCMSPTLPVLVTRYHLLTMT